MNKEDKKIYNKLNKNIHIPKNYIDTIYKTFNQLPNEEKNIKHNYNKLKLSILTTFCSFFFITSVVFGKNINEFFQGLLTYNKGIVSAIENNYIETNHSKTIESNNIKTYIDSVLMDDYKLCVSLSFELPEEYAKDNIHRINIPNIIIYDENNNILFQMATKKIDTSFFNNPELNNYNFSYETSFDIGWANKNGNTYSFSYIINSDSFPKSKLINIKFDEINLIDKDLLNYESNMLDPDIIKNATLFTIFGNWELQYELSEKTYNRNNQIYKIKNYDDFPFNFPKELHVSNTESRLEFSYDLHDIKQGEDISLDEKAYIKTPNDKLFLNSSEQEYNGYNAFCKFTFDLSSFNSFPVMQLIIPLSNGNDIILELEKIE